MCPETDTALKFGTCAKYDTYDKIIIEKKKITGQVAIRPRDFYHSFVLVTPSKTLALTNCYSMKYFMKYHI